MEDEDDESEEDIEEEFRDFIDDAPLDGSEAMADPEFAMWYSGWLTNGMVCHQNYPFYIF